MKYIYIETNHNLNKAEYVVDKCDSIKLLKLLNIYCNESKIYCELKSDILDGKNDKRYVKDIVNWAIILYLYNRNKDKIKYKD